MPGARKSNGICQAIRCLSHPTIKLEDDSSRCRGFFVSPSWLQVSNILLLLPRKKPYEILVWLLYPGEDLSPIFKHAELAAWGTATSFPSKCLCLPPLPSTRPTSRTKWQEPYRDDIAWAVTWDASVQDFVAGGNEDNLFVRNKEVMKYVVGDGASQHGLQRDGCLSH